MDDRGNSDRVRRYLERAEEARSLADRSQGTCRAQMLLTAETWRALARQAQKQDAKPRSDAAPS